MKLNICKQVLFEGRRSNVADYLCQSKLQVIGLANNLLIDGIVTNTPSIGVELGDLGQRLVLLNEVSMVNNLSIQITKGSFTNLPQAYSLSEICSQIEADSQEGIWYTG